MEVIEVKQKLKNGMEEIADFTDTWKAKNNNTLDMLQVQTPFSVMCSSSPSSFKEIF